MGHVQVSVPTETEEQVPHTDKDTQCCIFRQSGNKSPKQLHQSPFRGTLGHLTARFDLTLVFARRGLSKMGL